MAAAVLSAVRLPSPEPGDGPLQPDVELDGAKENGYRTERKQRIGKENSKPLTQAEKEAGAKAEYEKLLNMRSGGTYIPPARLKALQSQITDKTSKEYQRMAWETLKKAINGRVNKVNTSNIKSIVPELFNDNLIRGRGLFCRSVMKAQATSLPFTPILATMAAVVNTKLPQVGELLINRLIMQFRKGYKRNDKSVCYSSTTFMAHLINQQVVHEMLAAQILLLLLHKPTDDSVEIAVNFMKEVGQHLEEMNPQIALAVYDQFRSILHEAEIDKRVQYMIEVLFQVRKDRYKNYPALKEELDLVEEEDQITHRPGLDDKVDTFDSLNVFKFDPEWEANEEAYRKLKAEVLGDGSDEDDDDNDDASEESSEEEDEAERALEIKDQSNTDLVNLRKSIYLTIMSSGGFEEACHKLMRINLPSGREEELPSMIVECCSQEPAYNKFYGLMGERFCKINRLWRGLFEESFAKIYDTIHRYETNKLRIIAQFFGHLLSSDAIGWHVFNVIHLNVEETTSSSRVFIKILMQDLSEGVGMKGLTARLKADELQPALSGMFPTGDPKDIRFSINFFTAIGMGPLTDGMREALKNIPTKPPPRPEPSVSERSDSVSSYSSRSRSSYSDASSISTSRSRSRSRGNTRRRTYSRSPRPRRSPSSPRSVDRRRRRSYSDSRSLSRSRASALDRARRRSLSRSTRSPRRREESESSRSRSRAKSATRGRPTRYTRKNTRSPASSSRSDSRSLSSRRRSYSRSRFSLSESHSPPQKKSTARQRRPRSTSSSRSRSPPTRKRFDQKESARLPQKKRRRDSSSEASDRSTSRSRTISRSPVRKRRRSSSSPASARSNSVESRKQGRQTNTRDSRGDAQASREKKDKQNGEKTKLTAKADSSKAKQKLDSRVANGKAAQDGEENIHPSRRGLVSGGAGRGSRPKASDFI